MVVVEVDNGHKVREAIKKTALEGRWVHLFATRSAVLLLQGALKTKPWRILPHLLLVPTGASFLDRFCG
jgi:hypothetical protein